MLALPETNCRLLKTAAKLPQPLTKKLKSAWRLKNNGVVGEPAGPPPPPPSPRSPAHQPRNLPLWPQNVPYGVPNSISLAPWTATGTALEL